MSDEQTETAERVDAPAGGTVTQRLEAVLMIADEPLSVVSLATAVGAPVPAVRQCRMIK